MKRRIKLWLYWENYPGEQIPAYLEMCYEVILAKCASCEVILVTPDTLGQYLPHIPFDLDAIRLQDRMKNSIALKADYIRVALLQRFGGIWLDIDCIVLKDLGPIVQRTLEQHDFFGMQKTTTSGIVTVNFMASRPKGVVISEYLKVMSGLICKKLSNGESFNWADLGSDTLTPIVKKYRDICYLECEKNIHPVHWNQSDLIWSSESHTELGDFIDDDTIVFMLYNAMLSTEQKSLTRSQILTSGSLLGQLFNSCLES